MEKQGIIFAAILPSQTIRLEAFSRGDTDQTDSENECAIKRRERCQLHVEEGAESLVTGGVEVRDPVPDGTGSPYDLAHPRGFRKGFDEVVHEVVRGD